MTDPSPELQQLVSLSFAQQHPQRLFRGCKDARLAEPWSCAFTVTTLGFRI